MKRFKEIQNKFEKQIYEEVNLGSNPEIDNPLPPIDKIMIPIYKSTKQIHQLQTELNNTNIGIEEIIKASEILAPAESAANVMIATPSFSLSEYKHATAKISDAGNKLDNAIINQINRLNQKFASSYKEVKKWKSSYGYEPIEENRSILENILDDYSILQELADSREIHENISAITARFENYKIEIENIEGITVQIQELIGQYQKITTEEHMKDFTKETLPLIKKSILFGDGELFQQCKNNNYVEGINQLNYLEKEMKEASTKQKIVATKKELIQRINLIDERYKMIEDIMQQLTPQAIYKIKNSCLNPDVYNDYQNFIYFEDLIDTFRTKATALKERSETIINTEKTRVNERYINIKNLSEEIPKKISEINNYTIKANDLISELKELNEKALALAIKDRKDLVANLNTKITEYEKINQGYHRIENLHTETIKIKPEIQSELTFENISIVGKINSQILQEYIITGEDYLKEEYNHKLTELKSEINMINNKAVNTLENMLEDAKKAENNTDKKIKLNNVSRLGYLLGKITDTKRIEEKAKNLLYEITNPQEQKDKKNEKLEQIYEKIGSLERKNENLETGLKKIEQKPQNPELEEIYKVVQTIKEEQELLEGRIKKTYNQNSEYYPLIEALSGNLGRWSWTEKLNYATEFIKDKIEKGEDIKNTKDFQIVEHAYEIFNKQWKEAYIQKNVATALNQRSDVVDKLKIIYSFIEESRARSIV